MHGCVHGRASTSVITSALWNAALVLALKIHATGYASHEQAYSILLRQNQQSDSSGSVFNHVPETQKCGKVQLDRQAADLVQILAPHIQPSRVVAQAAFKHAAPSLTTPHLELLNSCVSDHLRQHTEDCSRLRLCSPHDQSKTPASPKKQAAKIIKMASATITASIVERGGCRAY